MSSDPVPTAEPTPVATSERAKNSPPDLRFVHYNDVYHLDPSSSEPQGGIARFIGLCKEYRDGERYRKQPALITLFSGDAFNPSLESSITKGSHMVPILNKIGTDCACVGNHDFDFGVKQFTDLTAKCNFPWLIANVLDPALGPDAPLGHAKKTHMMTSSNGIKIGLIGLGEREWLGTINSLPPNLIYKSATETAKELAPQLRAQGAEMIVCLTHMREPNDLKLAENTDGMIDLILGGHDHYYSHAFVKGTHVLRSGTDFRQLSYIEARRRAGGGTAKWDFDIWRRDLVSSLPEDEETLELAEQLTKKLKKSLMKPIGFTATPLDARFKTVRLKESNIGNFVCDIMRQYHHADCALMGGGTIRGEQVYPPGAIKVQDITTCFPFEDPVVVLGVTGKAIWDALENGVSLYPALEGRFPQVSNIVFKFDPRKDVGSRILSVDVGGQPLQPDKQYTIATRGYMGRGKDGFDSLLVKSEGGDAEEIVSEENGILISMMLRQYFMALRTVGQWKNLSDHWKHVAQRCHSHVDVEKLENSPAVPESKLPLKSGSRTWAQWFSRRFGLHRKPLNDNADSDLDRGHASESEAVQQHDEMEDELWLMRKYFGRWVHKVGAKSHLCDNINSQHFVEWTQVIAPRVEGRIVMVE